MNWLGRLWLGAIVIDIVGLVVEFSGTFSVMLTVLLPTDAVPLYVCTVMTAVPLVFEGISGANVSRDGVHVAEVSAELDIVPVFAPDAKLYVTLCVKLADFLGNESMIVLPIFSEVEETVGVVAAGTVNVTFLVVVPILVLPLYVTQVIVHVPLVALLHLAARSGIVHVYDAPTPVAIVFFVPPKV